MIKMCSKSLVRNGFTLIELMIVVMVIAILASIGYPAYTDHVNSSRRSEATAALLSAASAQERFYTSNSRYASGIGGAGLAISGASETGLYTITVNNNANASYTLTATPQWVDDCTTITLTNTGLRGATGDADGNGTDDEQSDIDICWGQ